MEELNKIVENYLKAKDTDYAIMINGDWGCGKSYYIDHSFKDYLTSIPCTEKPDLVEKVRKKAKGVFHWNTENDIEEQKVNWAMQKISLYGISSANDFYQRVFMSFNHWAEGWGPILTSSVLSFFNINTLEKNENVKTITRIPFNMVLVFDDLERISTDKISPIEVLGLINGYTEQQHRKVIIVCNEKAFRKKTGDGTIELQLDEEYKHYKEKTVRFTYTCKADIPRVYGELKKEYEADYAAYLEDDTELILSLFNKGGKDNIRTLKFFMDIYEKVYRAAQTSLSPDYAHLILRQLVITTLIYVMEYKVGRTVNELNSLHQQFTLDTAAWLQQYVPDTKKETKKENADTYSVDEVRAKYLPYYDEMIQLPWLVEYISTGALKTEDVTRYVQEQESELHRKKQSPAVMASQKLKYLTTIEDEDVKPTIEAVLAYVKNGDYKLYELLDAYSTLARYAINGIEDFKLYKKTDKLFKDALVKSAEQHVYDSAFDLHAVQWDRSAMKYEEVKRYYELRKFANELNAKAHMREYQNVTADFYKSIEEGAEVEEIASFRIDEKKRFTLQGIDWDRVLKAIMNLSSPKAIALTDCIGSLLVNDYSTWSEKEYEALRAFDAKVVAQIANEKHVRKMYMHEMSATIRSFLQNRTGK